MHSKIKKTMEFAQKAHQAQMYDQYPYFKHLQDVYETLLEHGYNETEHLEILVSSFLHDCLEDCAVSYSDLKKEFGEETAENVFCMTDELGRNRKEKKEKTYPKIRSNPDSIVIKLADRISNVRNSIAQFREENWKEGNKNSFLEMYRKEYKLFRWNLYVEGHAQNLWTTLDGLMEFKK